MMTVLSAPLPSFLYREGEAPAVRVCSIEGCVREATRRCNHPFGWAECSKLLCNAHAVPIGFNGERDFCPDHLLKPEPAELYLAILTLRKREHKVYRSGRRTHSIDGKRIWSDKMLLQLARAKA